MPYYDSVVKTKWAVGLTNTNNFFANDTTHSYRRLPCKPLLYPGKALKTFPSKPRRGSHLFYETANWGGPDRPRGDAARVENLPGQAAQTTRPGKGPLGMANIHEDHTIIRCLAYDKSNRRKYPSNMQRCARTLLVFSGYFPSRPGLFETVRLGERKSSVPPIGDTISKKNVTIDPLFELTQLPTICLLYDPHYLHSHSVPTVFICDCPVEGNGDSHLQIFVEVDSKPLYTPF